MVHDDSHEVDPHGEFYYILSLGWLRQIVAAFLQSEVYDLQIRPSLLHRFRDEPTMAVLWRGLAT